MNPHRTPPPLALDTVLVGGEFRVVGAVWTDELEQFERAHDAGDIRMEARLQLLREGRPGERALTRPAAPPPGFWHNCAHACGVEGCAGMTPPAPRPPPRGLLGR